MTASSLDFEHVAQAQRERPGRADTAPRIGIVLGSGLGKLGEDLKERIAVPYGDIQHMPVTRVHGHEGALLFGKLGEARVACLSGRVHLYEGHDPSEVVFGVRLLAALGVEAVLLTNAAGGIAETCTPGTLMLITDQLNLTGQNPLAGPNEARWGPRFPDMTVAYDSALRQTTLGVAARLDMTLATGVYAGLAGPTYETPAEVTMLERMGASAVGMSTVLETIALRHQGVRVLGLSCITNRAAGKSDQLLSHNDVAEVAEQVSDTFRSLVRNVVSEI